MKTYPGIYRAKCVRVDIDEIVAYVPQVFGDLPIPFGSVTGSLPQANDKGWVAFESGQANRPVWISAYQPVLTSPSGARFKLVVADDGTLSTTAV